MTTAIVIPGRRRVQGETKFKKSEQLLPPIPARGMSPFFSLRTSSFVLHHKFLAVQPPHSPLAERESAWPSSSSLACLGEAVECRRGVRGAAGAKKGEK